MAASSQFEIRSSNARSETSEEEPVIFYESDNPVGSEDSFKLLYNHAEVDIKKYREHPTRGIRHFRVDKVLTPYMFYTEFDMRNAIHAFKDWKAAMQSFYNNDKDPGVEKYHVKTSILFKYRCYAYHDSETGLWERVRVMKYCTKNQIAEIYMFEQDEFRIVPKSSIMELNPDFCVSAAYGFPTHLLNIQPLNGDKYWSREAVDYFKHLVEGKSFATIVVTRTRVPFPEGFPEISEYLGVVMIQRNPWKNITVQAELVKAGFAEPTGCLAGYSGMLEALGGRIGKFDLQSFEEETNDAFTTVVGKILEKPSADLVQETLKMAMSASETLRKKMHLADIFVSTQSDLFAPDMCTKHDESKDRFFHLPNIFKNAMFQVRFSHMSCPSVMYVQLENNINDLREMETALSLMVENEESIQYSCMKAGLAIAVQIQVTPNQEPTWVRGVVRHVLHSVKLLKVILVDYGSDISIKEHFTRYLPAYFQKIPGFAFRVHLDSRFLVPSVGRQWSSEAGDTFMKYMNAWNYQVPIYYAWIPATGSVLELRDFNQELFWDPHAGKWGPIIGRMSILNSVINSMNESALLCNLFTSIGIDGVYEVITQDEKQDYKFESLGEILCDCGFGVRLGPLKSTKGQHSSIVLACLDDHYVDGQKNLLRQKAGASFITRKYQE